MGKKPQDEKKRVYAYIDGFNLYYGIRDSKFRRFLWLNPSLLVQNLLRPDQELVCTKYFTARISGGKPTDRQEYAADRNSKRKRQSTYLDALQEQPNLQIFYGHYLDDTVECKKCGATWMNAEEKMTDVNIATEMMVDAFANHFDVALLVSADSDLVPPIRAIKALLPHKRINVAFPPARSSHHLKNTAHGQCVIGRATLKKSQLPETVISATGHKLQRPDKWS